MPTPVLSFLWCWRRTALGVAVARYRDHRELAARNVEHRFIDEADAKTSFALGRRWQLGDAIGEVIAVAFSVRPLLKEGTDGEATGEGQAVTLLRGLIEGAHLDPPLCEVDGEFNAAPINEVGDQMLLWLLLFHHACS
jgi:hypothetical protein